jgi:hypothetical protein
MYLSTWPARGESIGRGVAEKGPKGKCLEMNEEGGKRDGKLAGGGTKAENCDRKMAPLAAFPGKDPTLSGAGEDCFRGLLFRG